MAERLSRKFDLRGKRIVGIGSGRGEFLKLLAAESTNTCVGYDPSYDGSGADLANVHFVQDYYSDRYASEAVDFLVCRHTLEHIPEPLEFLSSIRRILAAYEDAAAYFEVPNALQVFAGESIWDLIYPHVLYFTPPSLDALLRRAGFRTVETGLAFRDEFLWIEAQASGRPAESAALPWRLQETNMNAVATEFADRFRQTVASWIRLLDEANERGKRVALWGAGARGVTFLNTLPEGGWIDAVIDLNPRKQGMYVAGTGQRIENPGRLRETPPQIVIALNPVYVAEIEEMLRGMEIDAEVISTPETLLKRRMVA